MTSALWGFLEMMTHDDRGEGVKNCQNGGDVICGWPLSEYMYVGTIWNRISCKVPIMTGSKSCVIYEQHLFAQFITLLNHEMKKSIFISKCFFIRWYLGFSIQWSIFIWYEHACVII